MSNKLIELNSSAYNYAVSISDQIQTICEPLIELGINYFSYMKIFNNGSYLAIDNDLEYRKAYFETIKDQGSFFTFNVYRLATKSKYKYFFLNDIEIYNRRNDPILNLIHNFKKRNCLIIYKLNNDGVYESYNFSIPYDDNFVNTFFLSNLDILEHFIDYFNERAQTLMDTSDKSKLAYLEQTFNYDNIHEDKILTEKIRSFLLKTRLQNRLMNGQDGQVKLAKREFECLHYLALGNSTKEIGHILGLSSRTIEFYLRNTKSKTGYKTKNKLLVQFIKDFKSVDFTET